MLLDAPAVRLHPQNTWLARRDGVIGMSGDRTHYGTNSSILTSGTLFLSLMEVVPGQIITNLSFFTGSTAAVTPTNWWVALYKTDLTFLRQSADQLTAAIGANAAFTLALSSAYTVGSETALYTGIMVAAATVPTLRGSGMNVNAIASHSRIKCGNSTTGLTTTAPSPAAAISVQNVDCLISAT